MGAEDAPGDGEGGDALELVARVLLGEHPAVVGREAGLVVAVVGAVGEVADHPVLLERRDDDATVEPPERPDPADDVHRPVLDLLEEVRHAVGPVDLCEPRVLVDVGVVVVAERVERLVGRGQDPHLVGLRLDAEVVVPGVVPAADVEVRDVLAGLDVRHQVGALDVAVEVVRVGRRHAGVVEVAGAVPHAVGVLDPQVAHLDRQEGVDRRLPDVAGVDVVGDLEGVRAAAPVLDGVEARRRHVGKIEQAVLVAEEVAVPRLRHGLADDLGGVGPEAEEAGRRPLGVAPVVLDDDDLPLRRVVPDLRDLDDRLVHPPLDRVRADRPLDGALGRAGRDRLADDEPPVVVLVAPVEEHDLARLALDRQAERLALGRDRQPPAGRERDGLCHALGVDGHRPVRLARELAARVAEQPRVTEQVDRVQLQVEPDLADVLGR